ncbi:MAG: S41 family peptidase [Bacteroidales bacterium]|nr:S41 family peptidase [Bacteroidales bacterium]
MTELLRLTVKSVRMPILVLVTILATSCITADEVDTSNTGVLRALWKTIDEHYCFFREKRDSFGVDWAEVYPRYAARLHTMMDSQQLFEVCAAMLAELRDGHVNLSAAHDVSGYSAWFESYPSNFSDTLQRIYLGPRTEYRVAAGISYRMLNGNIGYMRVPTFAHQFGEGNLSQILQHLAAADGLIVDIRSNSGGMLTAAQRLAACFVNRRTYVGSIRHKVGKAHEAFSEPTPIYIEPMAGLRWQKPVVVLTNRRTYSAANSFAAFVRYFPLVTLMGDKTGGGGGMPFSSELPNGWGVRLSVAPMADARGNTIEEGVAPAVPVGITTTDYQRGRDTMIEAAIAQLNKPFSP